MQALPSGWHMAFAGTSVVETLAHSTSLAVSLSIIYIYISVSLSLHLHLSVSLYLSLSLSVRVSLSLYISLCPRLSLSLSLSLYISLSISLYLSLSLSISLYLSLSLSISLYLSLSLYLSIYIYAVKLKTGPRFGGFKVKNWSKFKVKNWSKFFFFHWFPHFYSVFWVFLITQIVSHCAKIVFLQNFGDVKNEVFEKKIACFVFVFLCWRNRNRKKKNKQNGKAKKPYKNSFFLFKVVIQKCEKSKKWIFSKNCLTLFVSGREKKRAFSCTLSGLAQNFFWTTTV